MQGEKKNNPQLVIKAVKKADLSFPVQFTNYQ